MLLEAHFLEPALSNIVVAGLDAGSFGEYSLGRNQFHFPKFCPTDVDGIY